MPKTVTWDYIDESSFKADDPQKALLIAEEFLAAARDPETFYDEDVTPAALFIAASESFYDALLPLRAYEAAREAQDAPGDAAPDKRVYLIEGLLRTGQEAEANELAKALRAEKPEDPMVYSFLGDSYDAAGDAHNAERWASRWSPRSSTTPTISIATSWPTPWKRASCSSWAVTPCAMLRATSPTTSTRRPSRFSRSTTMPTKTTTRSSRARRVMRA
jgi:hypothetical protein